MAKLARLMADQETPVSKVYAETLGLAAALEMFRISTAGAEPGKPTRTGELSKSQRGLVQGYIEENLSKDIGLDELAAVCGLTRFHFSRSFKATFGEAPYQHLTRRRVERAQQMLAGSHISISDIAIACGFNGASQFARSFRNAVGQSPLAFRRGT